MTSRALVAVLFLSVAGCQCGPEPTPPCGPSTCAGCCDASGTCQSIITANACGLGGNACAICSPTQECVVGQCTANAVGGGGAGGGAAGGVTAGGTSGGSTGGGASGGVVTAGGASGGVVAGGTSGGVVMAGGASGGVVTAGGSSGGVVTAGGSSGGVVTAGGSSGGVVTAGGASGGVVTAGGASGGVATAGGSSGGVVTAGGASAGGVTAGGASGGVATAGGSSGGSAGGAAVAGGTVSAGGTAGGSAGGSTAGGSGGFAGGFINGGGPACPLFIGSMSTLNVDIPAVTVQLDVRLNGAPLPTLTNPAYVTNFPRLVLRPRATGGQPSTVTLYSGPASSGANYQYTPRTLTFTLLPGVYDVGYERNSASSTVFGAFPSNEGDTLVRDLTITTNGTVTIDIPTVTITAQVTLNGQPLTSRINPAYVTNFPRVQFRPLASNGAPFTFALFTGPTSSGAQYQYTPRTLTMTILPAQYDIAYERNSASATVFSDFPINEGDVIHAARSLTVSGGTAIDLQRVDITMPVTLNQAPLAILTSPAYATNFPRIALRPRASGGLPVTATLFSGPTSAGANYQYTPRVLAFGVLPGRYDLGYERNSSTASIFGAFPSNEGDTLVSDRVITTNGPVPLDVPTVSITVPVTLNGQPLSTRQSPSYVTNFPRVEVRPRAVLGNPFTLTLFSGPSSVGAQYEYTPRAIALTILPGSYDFAYQRNSASSSVFSDFPINEGDVFDANRTVVTAGPVPLAITRVDVTIPVTLNQSPLATLTSPSYVTNFPRLVLRPLASGGGPVTATLFSGPTSAGANYQYTPRPLAFGLLPGRYDLGYERNSASAAVFSAFPSNEGDTLVSDRPITSSGPVPVDLPAIGVTLNVFLARQPLQTILSPAYVTNFPRLELRPRASLGQPFTFATYSGPTSSGAQYEYRPRTLVMTILPGTYDVAYERNASSASVFGAFPINEGDQLACFTIVR